MWPLASYDVRGTVNEYTDASLSFTACGMNMSALSAVRPASILFACLTVSPSGPISIPSVPVMGFHSRWSVSTLFASAVSPVAGA